MPSAVRDLLAAYLARFPADAVTLPRGELDGDPVTVPWVIRGAQGGALIRNHVNHYI